MKKQLRFILAGAVLFLAFQSYGYVDEKHKKPGAKNNDLSYRSDCAPATMSYDLAINNVRSRLLNGGDVWWDLDEGQYIVPAVDPSLGVPGVSSLFAGAVWLGGFDDADNLKLAAQTYRTSTSNDFWPGPLSSIGTTGADTCLNWDRFFIVKGLTIRAHIRAFQEALSAGIPFNCETVPDELKKYPARGNPYWSQYYEFNLPNDNQGLGAFFDFNGDNRYDPCDGDYPAIEVKGCPTESNFPDEIVFWVYNDAGNSHTNTNGRPINMEVQVQAFAYATNDQINDMTFQRYKLINRAVLAIDSTYFGMWVDPDLGCASDDYIGCDTTRSLMYIYNRDEVDGDAGCDCTTGSTTYCNGVPILGVDYFRGPLKPFRETDTFHVSELPLPKIDYPTIFDTISIIGDTLYVLEVDHRKELGMSSFTYYVNGSIGNPPAQISDPQQANEYYRLLSGSWRDGRPFTQGGNGYNIGPGARPINYAFPGDPNAPADWSMCTAGLAAFDQRTIQATGPFRLDPGAINELIIGAVWVPDQVYPCPELDELRAADDLAQALFNNCFILPNGPDAPDLDFIELDRELIMVLSNDSKTSNNANELYRERGLEVPAGTLDSTYVFEGYLVYQLLNGNVTTGELDDVNKARLVFQVDKNNGISKLYNWRPIEGPNGDPIWVPELQVEGQNAGIRHTFDIREDQFAATDRRLVNHKHYYYTAIAYAYNEYLPFDPTNLVGQRSPYLEGRGNIKTYDPLPHPQTFEMINGMYGEGPVITRLDGVGAGENFLELADTMYQLILNDATGGEVIYRPGAGPVRVQVFNPLVVEDGEYIIEFIDPAPHADDSISLSTGWKLYNVNDPSKFYVSDKPIAQLNEQLIAELGISVLIGQSDDAGDRKDPSNGTIGYSLSYNDPSKPAWIAFVPDDFGGIPLINFIQTELPEYPNYLLDPDQVYSKFAPWVPFILTDYDQNEPPENPLGWTITPGWMDPSGGLVQSPQFGGNLQHLNNVDIIITSDTSKWSRCVVVETSTVYYTTDIQGVGLPSEGNKKSLQPRSRPSVGKYDADNDGYPDPDGTVDANGFSTGMGWFPGYAVDVETGERLNIFFGENSIYDPAVGPALEVGNIAHDMIWNPGKQTILPSGGNITPLEVFLGGQQFVYVTRTKYDAGVALRKDLDRTGLVKARALAGVTWCAIPLTIDDPTIDMLPLNQGLIPNDVTIKMRVDNPYQKAHGTGQFNDFPAYRFKLEGVTPTPITEAQIPDALAKINVVPNPYLAYSEYETSSFDNRVKITNLPPQCVVTIYSLDGRFIRQFTRNEQEIPNSPPRTNPPVETTQINPDLEWNLKNTAGIPVSSGIYLFHVNAPGLGERVIKWFGVGRQFDPSGL